MSTILTSLSAFLPFANSINDTQELYKLLDELSTVERSLFKGKEGTISEKARDFLVSNLIDIFVEIEKNGLEPEGDAKQLDFIKDLGLYLRDLPQVKVTMAFSPTNTFIAKLNNEIANTVGGKVVLDIVVNQYIVGGAIFEYRGKVSQYTLEERLNGVIEVLIAKNAEEIRRHLEPSQVGAGAV